MDRNAVRNAKLANQVQPNGGKEKDKRKKKMKESDGSNPDVLKQRSLQSCHWDASFPS